MVPAPLFEEDQENGPVWVDETQLQPPLTEQPIPVDRSRLGGRGLQSFALGEIWDDDVEETLYVRWFVDWQRGAHSVKMLETIPPNGTNVRKSSPYMANFCANELSALVGSALVDVVVADRDFLTDPLTNRKLPEDATSHTVTWFVQFINECEP